MIELFACGQCFLTAAQALALAGACIAPIVCCCKKLFVRKEVDYSELKDD